MNTHERLHTTLEHYQQCVESFLTGIYSALTVFPIK
jgi:hypothetical protein